MPEPSPCIICKYIVVVTHGWKKTPIFAVSQSGGFISGGKITGHIPVPFIPPKAIIEDGRRSPMRMVWREGSG